MEKAELIQQICEKIQEIDSQKRKDKRLAKTSRELKKAYESLKKYKTDENLNKQFQKELLSDGNASTRFRQEPAVENRANIGKEKKPMGKWLNGCEVCNVGLVTEMKKMVDAGVPVRTAANLLADL
jgi:hypothetical protein